MDSSTKSLELFGKIQIPKLSERFVVEKYFTIRPNGILRYRHPTLVDFIKKNPFVEPRDGYTILMYLPPESFLSGIQMQNELGQNSEVDLAALYFLLERQNKSGSEPLLMNGQCNLCLINGIVVWFFWGDDDDWNIHPSSPPDTRLIVGSKNLVIAKGV